MRSWARPSRSSAALSQRGPETKEETRASAAFVMTDVVVPTLGESVTEATVGKWNRKAGERVARDEVLVELETDKVAVEITAPDAGVLSDIIAPEGATVQIGALLA